MLFFTDSELQFLKSHNIDLENVLDARGLSKKEMRVKAKAEKKNFIIGTPCKREGHRLRTRSAHCIQCDTKQIIFQLRHRITNWLYLAEAKDLDVIKIGSTSDLDGREKNLKSQSYGGTSNWKMQYAVKIPQVGVIESNIHSLLNAFLINGDYRKNGKKITSREMFKISLWRARKVLEQALSKTETKVIEVIQF